MSDHELRQHCADLFGTSALCAQIGAEDAVGFPLWCMSAPLEEVQEIIYLLGVSAMAHELSSVLESEVKP